MRSGAYAWINKLDDVKPEETSSHSVVAEILPVAEVTLFQR